MFTFAVITCNRLHYLKNCISSIFEFVDMDGVDLLVLDNHTQEKGIDEYLIQVSNLSDKVHIKRFKDRHPCELYRSMNYAIEFSRNKGNEYVNFIQDDYQYLYKHPDMLEWIKNAFDERPGIVQLQTNMGWERKRRKIGKVVIEKIGKAKWFFLPDKAITDNGFTRTSAYDRTGLYPIDFKSQTTSFKGEGWFAKKCKKQRLKRMMLARPNMAMMMDCAYVRGNIRQGKYFPPPHKFYLKPFDKAKQSLIDQRANKNKMCFIETMVEADGWKPSTMEKHCKLDIKTNVGS